MPLEGLTFPNPTLGIQTKRKPRIEALRAIDGKVGADSLVIAYKEQPSFKARGVHQKTSQPFPCPSDFGDLVRLCTKSLTTHGLCNLPRAHLEVPLHL